MSLQQDYSIINVTLFYDRLWLRLYIKLTALRLVLVLYLSLGLGLGLGLELVSSCLGLVLQLMSLTLVRSLGLVSSGLCLVIRGLVNITA